MAFRSSISRSLMTTARSSLRSPPSSAARVRPSPLPSAPRRRPSPLPSAPRRRPSFSPSRNLEVLGGMQSLVLPFDGVVKVGPRVTSYLSVSARAFCELSQGT